MRSRAYKKGYAQGLEDRAGLPCDKSIRLRISIPGGVLFEAASEEIHYMARYGAADHAGDGWYCLFPGSEYLGDPGLVSVDVKPTGTVKAVPFED